jgi:hypothetical protein
MPQNARPLIGAKQTSSWQFCWHSGCSVSKFLPGSPSWHHQFLQQIFGSVRSHYSRFLSQPVKFINQPIIWRYIWGAEVPIKINTNLGQIMFALMGAWLFWNILYGFKFLDIVISVRDGLPRNWDMILGRVKWFFSSSQHPDHFGAQPAPIRCVLEYFPPGLKRPGCESEHLPPCSVNITNVWSYTFSPLCIFMSWCLIKLEENFFPFPPSLLALLCWHAFSAAGPRNMAEVPDLNILWMCVLTLMAL